MKNQRTKKVPSINRTNTMNISVTKSSSKTDDSMIDYRNYINPKEQIKYRFIPDQHTSKIPWQVVSCHKSN